MKPLHRVSILILSVFAFWSLLLVGFAVEETVQLSTTTQTSVSLPKNTEVHTLDPVTKERVRDHLADRIISNRSVVIASPPEPQVAEIIIEDDLQTIETTDEIPEEQVIQVEEEKVVIPTATTKTAIILPVPFTSQAPEGNWAEPWQEACEEASLLMTAHYFKGTKSISVETAVDDIFTLVEHQTDRGFDYHDSDMYETAVMGEIEFGLLTEVIENPTIVDITDTIDAGYPVIAPYAGRLLGNTHFTPPGPRYHVHVIIGYDEVAKEFITHDPGTRFGEQYRYSYETIMHAMHDWTGNAATIEEGAKRILVVKGVSNEHTAN